MIINNSNPMRANAECNQRYGFVIAAGAFIISLIHVLAFGATDSNTGLLLAVRSNNLVSVRSAITQGADPNQADKEGYTALMFAVMYGFSDKEMVDLLLARDAAVNAQASNGMTALMLASGAGSGGTGSDIIRTLLDHNADPKLKNKFDMTALMYAESAGRLDVAKLLKSRGAIHEPLPQAHELVPVTDDLTPSTEQRVHSMGSQIVSHLPSKPSDHAEWLSCYKDADCTSIEAGCYYWQPSNISHVSDMTRNYGTVACLKSVPAGPRPPVSCIDHVCANGPYTIHYWKLLQADPIDASIQNQWIGKRLESCLQGMPSLGTWDFLSWRDIYFRALVDQAIKENRFSDSTPIDVVINTVTSCDSLVNWQRGQAKWTAAQSASNRRVRIETIPMPYPLDDAYPPLIQYAKVLQQCGQTYTRAGVIFWGDMHVTFTINSNGTVDLDPAKTTYPATAYMHPFLGCVNTAFEKVTFASSKDHQPAHVTALIHVSATDSKHDHGSVP